MRTKTKLLRPLHPSYGVELGYRKAIANVLREMHRQVLAELVKTYRTNPPVLAQDDLASSALQKAMRELSQRWLKRFDDLAPKLAEYFSKSAAQRSSQALQRMLREAGIAVEFRLTPALRDVLKATIEVNVSLIKSIPQQYLLEIEGLVMRSVQVGRDLGSLTKELETRYGVAYRRAALIARDQNNKATAAINRVRQVEAGIEEAIWVHSHAGKTPRPSHVKAGRERVKFKVSEGWFDPAEGRRIQPGELINCRCVSRPVVEGFA